MTVPPPAGGVCSHASADKPRVAMFAERLRGDGIDTWVDKCEIGSGQ